MMSSKNKGFTASDIERYYSGKMSPQERHALEKAALDDPFLADALEGYAFTSRPSVDISKIQSRLDKKLDQKKVAPLFQKYKWLSVAAIVLVIAATGRFTYTISKTKNPAVALQKQREPAKKPDFTTSSQDHSTTNNNATVPATTPDGSKFDENQKNSKNPTKKNHAAPNQKSGEEVVLNNLREKEASEKNRESFSKQGALPAAKDKVASTESTYSSNSPEKAEFSKTASPYARADNATNFPSKRASLKHRDSTDAGQLAGKVSGIGSDTVQNLNIVLHPLPMDSAQVVVVGHGSPKKSAGKYPKVIIDTLEPAEGYVNFDDYIASNLKMPEELKDKPVEGEVQLSFDVDRNGQPVNITVVKSLCQKCDEEAIRLLKEGPKWKKKKNRKGKITIKL
jgi:hypothetical protein